MFEKGQDALLIGFWGNTPIYHKGAGGLLLTAGARSGKLRDVLAYNLCAGVYNGTTVTLDMKGELAEVSQNQTGSGKYCIYWNPRCLGGMPMNRINPVDYICIDSPSVVSDTKVFCENQIVTTGSPQGAYFEGRGREYLEAFCLVVCEVDGVLTLPRLFALISSVPGGGDEWLNWAFEMSESCFEIVRKIEQEIADARTKDSGGMQGIMGEVFKAVACLSDPVLMASVSPPYDFSLAHLCESDQTYNLYLMPPAEFIDAWAPVIKAIFVAGMIYKARAPQAPRQTWILDECAQLGGFPLVTKLFTYGAGIGIRPWAVFQSAEQMKALGPNADTIITSSAAVRQYFGIRDYPSARTISEMIGTETLTYVDDLHRARTRLAKQEAAMTLLNGGDPLLSGMRLSHHARLETLHAKQQRQLVTPDELLTMPEDKQYIFADGLPGPIHADRKPHYEQRFMAGRYHPNPYHPPIDRVRIKTWFGDVRRRVITEPVPPEHAHYPQYNGGMWSYIKGFK